MQNMSKHRWCGAFVLVIALWWTAPMPVHAAPFTGAVEYATSLFGGSGGGPSTFGYQFSTSVPFNVDALASWVDPLVNDNRQVALWDSRGALIVSTTVLNTDPIQGHFQYHSIPTFSLVPGAYTIGGTIAQGTHHFILLPVFVEGVVTVPGFTMTTEVSQAGAGLTYPSSTFVSPAFGQNAILIPNFSIVPAVAVPESSTLILLASGLLLCYGWRRKRAA